MKIDISDLDVKARKLILRGHTFRRTAVLFVVEWTTIYNSHYFFDNFLLYVNNLKASLAAKATKFQQWKKNQTRQV